MYAGMRETAYLRSAVKTCLHTVGLVHVVVVVVVIVNFASLGGSIFVHYGCITHLCTLAPNAATMIV